MNRKIYGSYPKDEEKFIGEYISVVDNKIVAHGKEPGEVLKIARQFTKEPLLTKIPLILGRLDVFDHFDIEFKQREQVTVFRPIKT